MEQIVFRKLKFSSSCNTWRDQVYIIHWRNKELESHTHTHTHTHTHSLKKGSKTQKKFPQRKVKLNCSDLRDSGSEKANKWKW